MSKQSESNGGEMSKIEVNEKTELTNQFNLKNGFLFGFGFFLANLVGVLILGMLTWIMLFLNQQAGLL